MKRPLLITLLVLLVVFGARNVSTRAGVVSGPCRVGHQAPAIGFWTWATNARVKVYVRSEDFNAEQTAFIVTALQNWSEVSELTASGVKFEYQGDTRHESACDNCLTVTRGPVFDKSKRHATELRVFSAHSDQIINYALIIVDRDLTNPKAILNAMAHELGHNMGLLDCYNCESGSTLMNQFKAMNVSNYMERPTPCDIAQVKEAYKELKIRIRRSPTRGHSLYEDEGEDPVDDDTPIVVPQP